MAFFLERSIESNLQIHYTAMEIESNIKRLLIYLLLTISGIIVIRWWLNDGGYEPIAVFVGIIISIIAIQRKPPNKGNEKNDNRLINFSLFARDQQNTKN